MINIKQLRIGSYVMYEQTTYVVTGIGKRLIRASKIGHDLGPMIPLEELGPIPLTEEILLKCGFNKDDYKKGHIGIDYESGEMTFDFVLEEPGFMGEWDKYYTFELPNHRFVNMKYLHSLQNLFYAICGVELEFNNGNYGKENT